jgi:acyl-coenzyme A synthetase/AMP-(fatty) acid ligase
MSEKKFEELIGRLRACTALTHPVTVLSRDEMEFVREYIYDNLLYEKWYDPADPNSLRDMDKLAVYSKMPKEPDFHKRQEEKWDFYTRVLEAMGLHPDHREWSRKQLAEEGFNWDETIAPELTRLQRREELRFYKKGADERYAERYLGFTADDVNKDTVLVIGGATANNKGQISKSMRVMEGQVLKQMGIDSQNVIYLSEQFNYFTESSVEAHRYNQDPEHYASERAKVLAHRVFGPKISRGGITVDEAGNVSGERLPLDEVKRNLRVNLVGISRGCALLACAANELERAMHQLGYEPAEISEATKQVFGLMVGSSTRFVPKNTGATIEAVLSENDLLVRSRVDTEPLFEHIKPDQKTTRVDVDDRQSVFLARIPKIVMVERKAANSDEIIREPFLKDGERETRYDIYGHSYTTYVRDNFVEFDHAPGYALANAVGADDISNREALFTKPLAMHFPQEPRANVQPIIQAYADQHIKHPDPLPREAFVDDAVAAEWVELTLRKGDALRTEIRTAKEHDVLTMGAISADATQFLNKLEEGAADFNFASILRTRANDPRTANRTFLTLVNEDRPGGVESYTYSEAERKASQIRRMFEAHGISKDSKVALRCICPEHLFTRNAVLGAGGMVSPLSISYGNDDLSSRLELIGVDAIVTTPDKLKQTLEVREQLGKPIKIFVVERGPNGERLNFADQQKLKEMMQDKALVYPFLESMHQYSDRPVPIMKTVPGQPAFSMATSGSSGVLKQVQVPHSYALASYIRGNSWWGVNGAATAPEDNSGLAPSAKKLRESAATGTLPSEHVDKVFCTAPFGWMYPYRGLVSTEMSGAEFVMAKTVKDNQNPAFTVKVLEEKGITLFAAIPTNIRGIVDQMTKHPTELPKLRRAISTAERLNETTINGFRRVTGIKVANGYASTEEGPIMCDLEGMNIPEGSVGVPVPGLVYKLVDLNPDEKEEFGGRREGLRKLVIAPSPVSGKYQFPPGTSAAIEDAYTYRDFETGTVFRDTKDAAAFSGNVVTALCRTDEMMKRSGIQIIPHEVEKPLAIYFNDNDAEAVAKRSEKIETKGIELKANVTVGVDDDLKTTIVVAYIELSKADAEKLTRADLLQRLNGAFNPEKASTRLKIPDYVIIGVADFERMENKPPKKAIKDAVIKMVNMFRAEGEIGGSVMLPVSATRIEKMSDAELADAFKNMDVLRSRSGKMGEEHKEPGQIEFATDAVKSVVIPSNTALPVQVQYYEKVCDVKAAAKAIPVVKIGGEYHFLLTQRGKDISMPGAIVFPGGAVETHRTYGTVEREETLATAMRETLEEIGLRLEPNQMHELARTATVTGFAVQPYLAVLDEINLPRLQKRVADRARALTEAGEPVEVEQVFTIPVRDFYDKKRWTDDKISTFERGNAEYGVPVQKYKKMNYPVTVPGLGKEPDKEVMLGSMVVETMFHLISYHQTYEKFAKEMDFILQNQDKEFVWKEGTNFPDMSQKRSIEDARREFLEGREFPNRTNFEQHDIYMAQQQAAGGQGFAAVLKKPAPYAVGAHKRKEAATVPPAFEMVPPPSTAGLKVMEDLTLYEARAMLQVRENQTAEIKVEAIQRLPGGTYTISLVLPETVAPEVFNRELTEVRARGYSKLDTGDVSGGNLKNTQLPALEKYAEVEILSNRPARKVE